MRENTRNRDALGVAVAGPRINRICCKPRVHRIPSPGPRGYPVYPKNNFPIRKIVAPTNCTRELGERGLGGRFSARLCGRRVEPSLRRLGSAGSVWCHQCGGLADVMVPASRLNFRKMKKRVPTPPPLFPATTFTTTKKKMAS